MKTRISCLMIVTVLLLFGSNLSYAGNRSCLNCNSLTKARTIRSLSLIPESMKNKVYDVSYKAGHSSGQSIAHNGPRPTVASIATLILKAAISAVGVMIDMLNVVLTKNSSSRGQ